VLAINEAVQVQLPKFRRELAVHCIMDFLVQVDPINVMQDALGTKQDQVLNFSDANLANQPE
jgi:hypothetical protein